MKAAAAMVVLDEPAGSKALDSCEVSLGPTIHHHIRCVPRRVVVRELARRAQSEECGSYIGGKRRERGTMPFGGATGPWQRCKYRDGRNSVHAG